MIVDASGVTFDHLSGVSIHADGGVFPPGSEISVDVGTRPEGTLPATALVSDVVSITTLQQPGGDVELVVPYRASAVPEGASPLLARFEPNFGWWVPIPSVVDPVASTVTATVTHLSDYGVLLDNLDGWPWWWYQIEITTGRRVEPPVCGDESLPPWAESLTAEVDLQAPLYECHRADGDNLIITVRNNRPYGTIAQFSSANVVSARAVGITPGGLADLLNESWPPMLNVRQVFIATGSEIEITLKRPQFGARVMSVTLATMPSAASLLLDSVVAAVATFGPSKEVIQIFNCVAAQLQASSEPAKLDELRNAGVRLVKVCVNPVIAKSANIPVKALDALRVISASLFAADSVVQLADVRTDLSRPNPVIIINAIDDQADTFTPLVPGASGPAVEDLQRTLAGMNYDIGGSGVDGDFGPATEAAVRAFQRHCGLEETGQVDAATQDRLLAEVRTPTCLPAALRGNILLNGSGIGGHTFGSNNVQTVLDDFTAVFGEPSRSELMQFPYPDGVYQEYTDGLGNHYDWPVGHELCWQGTPCLMFGGESEANLVFTGWAYNYVDHGSGPLVFKTADGLREGATLAELLSPIPYDPAIACYFTVYASTDDGIEFLLQSQTTEFADFYGELVLPSPEPADIEITWMSAGQVVSDSLGDC